jgi:tRNA(Met) C34 N-acetyltransferase TmcA
LPVFDECFYSPSRLPPCSDLVVVEETAYMSLEFMRSLANPLERITFSSDSEEEKMEEVD